MNHKRFIGIWRWKPFQPVHFGLFWFEENKSSTNELNVLTDEGEGGGEDEKHSVAVHGERDGEVSGQAAPYEELVHCRPVMGVQAQLENVTFYSQCAHFIVLAYMREVFYLNQY